MPLERPRARDLLCVRLPSEMDWPAVYIQMEVAVAIDVFQGIPLMVKVFRRAIRYSLSIGLILEVFQQAVKVFQVEIPWNNVL